MRYFLRFLLIACLVWLPLFGHSQPFKSKYHDPNVNVNDLIAEAEAWYKENGTGPGKGWKGFNRWRYDHERRFYPSGDRSQFNPLAAAEAYARFKAAQPAGKVQGGNGFWTFRGPSSVDNILPPSWAAGLGIIQAVWAGAATPDTVYCGSAGGGFWKSVDGGAHWRATTQDLPAVGVIDIEVHPLRHNEVWILTWHSTDYSLGLLKSTDYGDTWNTTGLSYSLQQAYAHELVMESADTFFVASSQGILRSTDAGTTWTNSQPGIFNRMRSHPTNSQIVYAFEGNGSSQMRRTSNGGQSWTTVNIAGSTGDHFFATTVAQPNSVWVGSGAGIYRSTDAGLTWAFVCADPTNSGIMCLGVSGTQPDDLYAGSLSHYRSTDGGATWGMFSDWVNYYGNNYMHADMRVWRTWGNHIYAGTDGFLNHSSDNGQTWSIISQGVGVKDYYRIGCTPMNADNMVGGTQDNGTNVMLDGTWYEWIGADGMQAHFDYNHPDTWFGTIQFGNLQRTDQAGQNATGIAPDDNGAWVTPSVIDPNNENTLFIGFDSLYKSNDNGDHWQFLAGFPSGSLDEIAISPSDSNVLYLSRGGVIRRSTDNGHTWAYINAGLPGLFISRIAVHPEDPMHLVVCLSGFNSASKVYESTNGGSNWTNLTGNLPNLPSNAIAWIEGPPSRMVLGMDVGVYYADEGSNNWTLYADSLPAVLVNDLEVLNGAGILRVGTWGRGAWDAPIPGRDGMPQIVRVMMDPASEGLRPRPADTVHVTAVIRNLGGIQSATLRWGTTTGSQPNVVPMALVQGDTFLAGIPPLPEGTHVYYRITGTAPNGDSARTERLMYQVKAAIPCAATGAQGTTFDFIDTVRVGSLNYVSGQEYYGDFRNIYTALYRDSSYTVETWLNYSFALDSMFMWIDWNHDADFHVTEQYVMSDLDQNHRSFASITVPHVATIPDTVTMRVRSVYGNNLVADPCGSYFGEVEDYSLVLTDPVLIHVADASLGGLQIFPNPAGDAVTIGWPAGLGTAHVQLRDLQGRSVYAGDFDANSSCRIGLRSLAAGAYFVEVGTVNGPLRGRLLIAR